LGGRGGRNFFLRRPGPGHAGVLIHEAVGHLLEADFTRKKTSVFWNRAESGSAPPE